MAKKFVPAEKATTPKFPSLFGSHASMIDEALTKGLCETLGHDKMVVLIDEHGAYTTERNRLDNKLADPNRYSGRVKVNLVEEVKEEEKDVLP